jgi:uroporphyrinogen decarboxylase
MITSQERFLAALRHEKPDRAPFNFWMDRRLMARHEQRIGHRHWRVTHYGADVIETFAPLAFPPAPGIERDGTWWQTGPALADWRDAAALKLPDPANDKVYRLIGQDLAEFPDTAIILDMPTPWGIIAGLRTYELAYMDVLDRPEDVLAMARRIADLTLAVVERACRMGITALYLMEDLADSRGLTLSPAMIRRFSLDLIRPHIAAAKAAGKPVLFHSDGKLDDLLPLLKEYGLDAVNPLQPHLNDPWAFKAAHGRQLALYGGLDNCFIIPNGTAADVRAHVLDVFEAVGRPDGALIFSTHDIPLDTPPENIEAMVAAIKECRY